MASRSTPLRHPNGMPAAISSAAPRDHVASSNRCLASPNSSRDPARGQQSLRTFVTQPPGTRGRLGCWSPEGRGCATRRPALAAFQRSEDRTHCSGAPSTATNAVLVGSGLAPEHSPEGFALWRDQTACRSATSTIFSTRQTLEKSMQS